jgi:hypothetical protein
MIKFLLGVFIGLLIFFFFFYFGGGKTVKKVGEGLTETGKKMEVMEETVKKGKEELGKEGQKRIFKFKEEKDVQKKSQ